MRRSEQLRVMAEIADLLANDRVPMADHTLEKEVFRYTDPGYTQRELASVFALNPRVIAVSAQVPDAGDFFADEVSGEPLLITRGQDGVVRGFYNVCVHRGTKVVCQESGSRKRHACPFHGWTYDSEGRLRGVTEVGAFPDLGEGQRGLAPLNVVERHGLVWRLPDGWSEEDLGASLGGLDDELASYEADQMLLDRTATLEQPMNWKFVIDGFLETYHFKYLHRDTIGPYVRSNFGPTDTYERHTRMIVLRASYDTKVLPDPDADPMPHIAVAYQLFPNTVLVWQGTHIEIWTSYPTNGAADHCNIRVTVVIPDPAKRDTPDLDWDRNWEILMGTVLNEDFEVSRQAQAGLRTGALDKLVFGRNEPALQAYHRNLASEVAGTGQPRLDLAEHERAANALAPPEARPAFR